MKSMMQRWISWILVITLMVGLVPTVVPAAFATEATDISAHDHEGEEHPEEATEETPEVTDAAEETAEAEEPSQEPETAVVESVSAKKEASKLTAAEDKKPTLADFKGKKVSILGDSISTYVGVSNNASYNSTIGGNKLYYSSPGSKGGIYQQDTWWQQVTDVMGMELLVNNSWTGSCVWKTRAGTPGAYLDRCVQLHNDHTNEDPDVIMVFMGTNDMSYFSDDLGTPDQDENVWGEFEELDLDSLITNKGNGKYAYSEPQNVYEAYAIMLHKISVRYPDAQVYCLGLMARRDPVTNGDDVGQPTSRNANLKTLIEDFGFTYVDLESAISSEPSDFDKCMYDKRVHPNKIGHDRMTTAVISAMLEEESEFFDITKDLTNAAVSNGSHVILGGTSYKANVRMDSGYEVVDVAVTMGGEDITASCYTNGIISIPQVTGALVINVVARNPYIYRWEYNSQNDAIESILKEGYTANNLTMTGGTMTGGAMSNVAYTMSKSINLLHNKEWVIEWKSTGDWRGMLLSSTKSTTNGMCYLYRNSSSDLVAFGSRVDGTYQNYGIDLTDAGLDMSQPHVWRMENRIAADGSNMVYLSVDGQNMGAMNNYFTNSTDNKQTVNWLSGKDLTFSYMGASSSQLLNDMSLEYMQIWADGGTHQHSYMEESAIEGNCAQDGKVVYVCACGDRYEDNTGKIPSKHNYGEWEVVDGVKQRKCQDCGNVETAALKNYRWEMNAAGDALVSVTTNGALSNDLVNTKGTVSGGATSKFYAAMNESVVLKHDQAWAIEWKATGKWNTMLLSETSSSTGGKWYVFSNDSNVIAMGRYMDGAYQNYGTKMSKSAIDWNGTHVWRLENRIEGDTNMVYLLVDGNEIGAMNKHYTNSKLVSEGDNTLAGVDFTFGYIGTSNKTLDAKLHYLHIWAESMQQDQEHQHAYSVTATTPDSCTEAGTTTYTCSCGDTYTETTGTVLPHAFGEWETVDGKLRRECANCDAYEVKEAFAGYRWEMNAAGNALVSVTTGGNVQNDPVNAKGTITDGKTSKYYAALSTPVTLSHDKAWTVEWQATGKWNTMLLSSSKNSAGGDWYIFSNNANVVALGHYVDGAYQNYGIDVDTVAGLKIDWTATHTWCLENRLENGSNMVYLLIDGNEICAMNKHYSNSTLKGEDDNTLAGLDFEFNYIGSANKTLDTKLHYLQIWPEGEKQDQEHQHAYSVTATTPDSCTAAGTTTYTCACGDTYTETTGTVLPHAFGTWVTVDGQTRRDCADCDAYEIKEVATGYRWEMNAAGDALVSVTTDGNAQNDLIDPAGTVSDGKLSKYYAAMTEPVSLQHNKAWVIEWKTTGKWNTMLLSETKSSTAGEWYVFSNAKNVLAIGYYTTNDAGTKVYKNYGVKISDSAIDWSATHTWRIENRIENGSNMPYIFVDGRELGTMNKLYENSTLITKDGQVDNTLAGVDLDFSYIGTINKTLDTKLHYLQIWPEGMAHEHTYKVSGTKEGTCVKEGATVYTCSQCGDSYEEPNGKLGSHAYGEWFVDGDQLRRECADCDAYENKKLTTGYRWEMNEEGNALVSIATGDNATNPLTQVSKNGIVDGMLNAYGAAMETPITLLHDKDWAIEWKSSGAWTNMFLASGKSIATTNETWYVFRNDKDVVAIGQGKGGSWNNYGLKKKLNIDLDESHIWRLENRVGYDGSNMVYLMIDGVEIGALNTHYIASNPAPDPDNYKLNGLDLTISHIGSATSSRAVTGMKLDYLQIWPNGAPHAHTYEQTGTTEGTCVKAGTIIYTCTMCGETYEESNGILGEHIFGEWFVDGEQMRRECENCNAFERQKVPMAYRWELNETKDGLVNVTKDGNRPNALKVSEGTVTDGQLTGYAASLANPVTLSHDKPWIIEWKASGDWDGIFLNSRSAYGIGTNYLMRIASSDLIALGNRSAAWNNYGIKTAQGVDAPSVWRLENRIAADGSNMVYLTIDGRQIGAMNGYHSGSNANYNKDGNWLNGQDLTFGYIGATNGKELSGMNLEYLQIWTEGMPHDHVYEVTATTAGDCQEEGTITSTCSVCGDVQVEKTGKLGAHTYGPWEEVNGQEQRECTKCGHSETKNLKDYRWEMNSTKSELVNVSDGYTKNALTKTEGSIEGGEFISVAYSMEAPITLAHDKEWYVEWEASGEWGGMLLLTNKSFSKSGTTYIYRNKSNGLFAIGERKDGKFHNYGFKVTSDTVDMTTPHTWRVENRVNADGSNMIYLVIDSMEIGALRDYYVGSTAQNEAVDWANGRDMVFQHIGSTSNHQLTNINLNYLYICADGADHQHAFVSTGEETVGTCATPGYTTGVCHCGVTSKVPNGKYGEHTFGPWYEKDGEMRRDCSVCGNFETKVQRGYRWEFDSEMNELVSVTTDGNTENKLTKLQGSISNGMFSDSSYKMKDPVVLNHDVNWCIEWKASGDWNGMLLSSTQKTGNGMTYFFRNNSSDVMALGSRVSGVYQNYGFDFTSETRFDVKDEHVWRMENRVAEDGSNMVHLIVDDLDLGPMNKHYQNSTYQQETVDWMNGRDLTFQYIGAATSQLLGGMELQYLQIYVNDAEHRHSYTVTDTTEGSCQVERDNTYLCHCGYSYTGPSGEYGDHAFSAWTTVGGERQRTCQICNMLDTVQIGAHYDESVSNNYYHILSQKNYVLCDGITESEIILNNSAGTRRQILNVLEVDVNNPNVEILAGYYGVDQDLTDSKNWSARTMDKTMDYYRDVLGYNVVAGMNTALTYVSDAPCSFFVFNGQVLAEPGSIYNDNCDSYLAVIKKDDGTVECEMRSASTPLNGNEWQAIPCNFSFCVKDGEMTNKKVDRSSYADRSLLGIKKDGSLMVVQVEGENAALSTGLTQYELSETMKALDCIWAINGDGGGSSQIFTKREGEDNYTLRNRPSDGAPRATINGIILASKAKADGVFDHVSMVPQAEMIAPKGNVAIDIKGVDGSGAPAEMPEGITYEVTGGYLANGTFYSDGTEGIQKITAFYNGEQIGSAEVNVVLPTSIFFDNSAMAVPYGQTVDIRITAYYGTVKMHLSDDDVTFTMTEELGTVDGLKFTAVTEDKAGDKNDAEMTATLNCAPELKATISLYVGKGSEVIYDFEDQDLHGWRRSTAANYNSVNPGGSTKIVDRSTGKVRSGDYAMAVEIDYSNSLEPHFRLATLVAGEKKVFENAVSMGFWIYFPDEADGLMINANAPAYSDEMGLSTIANIYGNAGVSGVGDTDIAAAGFLDTMNESGWRYVTIDLSDHQYTGLGYLQFYISQKSGVNGYNYGEHSGVNGKYVLYVDDITIDYSYAVEDREPPVFSGMTYSADGATYNKVTTDHEEYFTVSSNSLSFAAQVADDTTKSNYTGINMASGKVTIDGVDHTKSMTWSSDGKEMQLNGVTLPNGTHSVKFSVCDNQGNYNSIVRHVIVRDADLAKVKVVPHDPEADRILLGSLYYVDIVADDPETISSVEVTLDLNNISKWELDHMDVADGFKATYSLVKDENIATVTVRSTGKTSLSGEDQILVSIPVRTWELEAVEPIYGHDGKIWMYDAYRADDQILPMNLSVEIDAGFVTYKNGATSSFTSPMIDIDTEMCGNACTSSGDAILNYIGDEEWYFQWNGGHDHRPSTKQYYLTGSTNHVMPTMLPNQAATCTEDGYTGRTFCDVCNSVVDWGRRVPATGHSNHFVDGVLVCQHCNEPFTGIHTDGKTYFDGVADNGWINDSYYVDGIAMTGVQKVPSPDDKRLEYYYDFGADGVCENRARYTGPFHDGEANRFAYLGELVDGWQTADDAWYYIHPNTLVAASGKVTVDGVAFQFAEDGRLTTGTWVEMAGGKRYYYGPGYHQELWAEIDGTWYYFEGGYVKTGVCQIRRRNYFAEFVWADLGEDGAFSGEYIQGFFTAPDGGYRYADDGAQRVGLHKINGDYYFFAANGAAAKGEYYAWESHCELPCDTYLFGDDYKMLQGIIEKDGDLYYYKNGKIGAAGITKVGEDYYFVSSSGKLAVNRSYYCWATNCEIPVGTYEFGADGKMINPPVIKVKNGDVNGDGSVNDEDVITLLWYTLLPDLYPIQGNADFNDDGSINDEDVIYLLWHTLLPDLYPL